MRLVALAFVGFVALDSVSGKKHFRSRHNKQKALQALEDVDVGAAAIQQAEGAYVAELEGLDYSKCQKGYLALAEKYKQCKINKLDVYWTPTGMGKLATGTAHPDGNHKLKIMLEPTSIDSSGETDAKMPKPNTPYHSWAYVGVDCDDGSPPVSLRLERTGSISCNGIPLQKPLDAQGVAKQLKKKRKKKKLIHRVSAYAKDLRGAAAIPVPEFLNNMATIAEAIHGLPTHPKTKDMNEITTAAAGNKALEKNLNMLMDPRWQNYDPRSQNCQHETWYIMRSLMEGPPLVHADGAIDFGSVTEHGETFAADEYYQDFDKLLDSGRPKLAGLAKIPNMKVKPAKKSWN